MLEPVRRFAASIACALGLVMATFGSAHDRPAATPESPSPFYAEMATADTTMHRDMTIAPSGDLDRDFLRMMMPHHQGAIDMAKAELIYGKDQVMRRLAQEIIVDQQSEIDAMQLWLTKTSAANKKQEK
jgi:uncharacterized protein (DUF305 family)